MSKIIDQLDEEISRELDILSSLQPDDDGYTEIVSGISTLAKVRIDVETNTSEEKKKQLFWDNMHKGIGYSLTALGIVAPMIFYGVWLNKGLRFEQDGTLVSPVFRSFWSKLKPTK